VYLKFFNLKEFPFAVGADPRFFYESGIHAEALANMQYVVEQRKGMVVITGEVGAGKTFLSSILADRLERVAQVVMITHPPDSAKQLLRAVAEGLDIKTTRVDDKLDLVAQLEKSLERLYRRGKLVAALFDEAQDMPDEALEQIRLLSNLEEEHRKLLQIVLSGQPELKTRLEAPALRQSRQRITVRFHIPPLAPGEVAAYIEHRLRTAGAPPEVRFDDEAAQAVERYSHGIPRLINAVCDYALLAGFMRETHLIDGDCVERAVAQLEGLPA